MIRKHISTLLCIVATAGIAATAILTAKATPKAMTLLDKAKEEKGEELTATEKVVKAAPAYIPAAVTGVMTAACIFGANVLSIKQQASIASAYGILHANHGKYVEKVKELFGIKTHEQVMEAIAVEKADEKNTIYAPGIFGGSTSLGTGEIKEEKRLFYDAFSQRYFESTYGRVLDAEYNLNRNFALGADVTLNDFYLFLGIDKIDGGDDIGWADYNGEIGWIDFDNIVSRLDDGREYIMICMVYEPVPFEDYA